MIAFKPDCAWISPGWLGQLEVTVGVQAAYESTDRSADRSLVDADDSSLSSCGYSRYGRNQDNDFELAPFGRGGDDALGDGQANEILDGLTGFGCGDTVTSACSPPYSVGVM